MEILTDEAKTYAKQHQCNLDAQTIFVEYGEGFKRWHDVKALKKAMTKEELNIAKVMGVFVQEEKVDSKLLKQLVRSKKIRPEVEKEAFRSERTQQRAEIKEKNV